MKCEVCGERLVETNEYGIIIGCNSCEHWRYCGEVYPSLWSEEEQRELEELEKREEVILIPREQGGYYCWERN